MPGGTDEEEEEFSKDSRCAGQDLNPAPPE